MYKYSWTVRTYNILCRYSVAVSTPAEAEAAAATVLAGKYRNAGKRTAVELLRAAGWGVYNIHAAVNGLSIDAVRDACERFDTMLHVAW